MSGTILTRDAAALDETALRIVIDEVLVTLEPQVNAYKKAVADTLSCTPHDWTHANEAREVLASGIHAHVAEQGFSANRELLVDTILLTVTAPEHTQAVNPPRSLVERLYLGNVSINFPSGSR